MSILFWIIIANLAISLIAFAGIVTLLLGKKSLEKIILWLVALSAGAMMGSAFLDLIPEAAKNSSIMMVTTYTLVGFMLFFMIERLFFWRHCHKPGCTHHTFAYMNLIGDSVHNFIDGLAIAASFLADFRLGMVTSIAVMLHEIPQEIGDFGVLVHGGFDKFKALLMNFLTALTAIIGGILGFYFLESVPYATNFLIPITAGGFIYIATTDLIPEIRKETELSKSLVGVLIFILGISITLITKIIFS